MSSRTVLLTLLAVVGSTALAVASAAPPVKPLEVVTVGVTPATFSDADRAKLAEVVRRLAAESTRPKVWRPAAVGLTVKPVDASMRSAAVGVRNREKPVQAAPDKAGQP